MFKEVCYRVQFGHKLREFGNVKEKVASMIARHYVTESIVYMAIIKLLAFSTH